MAAEQVLYILKTGGDLAGKLPKLADGLDKLAEKARAAKARVAELGTVGREKINAFDEGLEKAVEGTAKVAGGLALVGVALHSMMAENHAYKQSVRHLVDEVSRIGTSLGDELAPAASSFIKDFTVGLVFLTHLMKGIVSNAISHTGSLLIAQGTLVKESLAAGFKDQMGKQLGLDLGADESIAKARKALEDLRKEQVDSFTGVQDAIKAARDAAEEAFKRQSKDIIYETDKVREAYADVVETISGLRGPAGDRGEFTTRAPIMGTSQNSGLPGPVQVDSEELSAALEGQTTQLGGLLERNAVAMEAVGGGVSGVLNLIPVFGGYLAGIWEVLSNFGGITESIVNELMSFFDNLGAQFRTILIDLPLKIIENGPRLIAEIIGLIPRIILQMIASAPMIFAEVIEAIFDLPAQIGREFGAMFQQFVEDIKEAFGKIGDLFTGKEGKFLGTSLAGKENAGNRSLFGIKLPSFDDGGRVTRTGLAMVHAGEEYSGVGRRLGGRQQPTSVVVNLHAHGISDPDRLIREFQKRLGTLGIGLSLEPRGV